MKISTINLVYFSATYSTRNIMRIIGRRINGYVSEYDITKENPQIELKCKEEDLLLIGVPVYAGRIPPIAKEALNKLKGNNTPAIIVCVYGNRDYDDALLELKNEMESRGFKIVSAAAFIAQHSIFPMVGKDRPDNRDILKIKAFADRTADLLRFSTDIISLPEIDVPGNFPYKEPGKIPVKPKGNKKCDKCGICVKLCPVQAIPAEYPNKTEKKTCISCGRCVVVCPQEARSFGGLMYKLGGKKFFKANSERKEPDVFFI